MTAVRGTGLVLLTLLAVTIPRLAASAVVVAEPTGDVDPAFLAELRASLNTVAAEAPSDLNGELRSSATVKDDGIELVVEFMPADGSTPIHETRIASKASALSQARAMGKAAIKVLVAHGIEKTGLIEARTASTKPVAPSEAPVPSKYNRRAALRMSVLPTILVPVAGGALMLVAALAVPPSNSGSALFVAGAALAGVGIALGPTPGYFYIGRWGHALAMFGLRAALIATGAASLVLFFTSTCDKDENCDDSGTLAWMVLSMTALTASLLVAVIDSAFTGRAAERANTAWRSKKKESISATLAVLPSRDGKGTVGLVVQGTF